MFKTEVPGFWDVLKWCSLQLFKEDRFCSTHKILPTQVTVFEPRTLRLKLYDTLLVVLGLRLFDVVFWVWVVL